MSSPFVGDSLELQSVADNPKGGLSREADRIPPEAASPEPLLWLIEARRDAGEAEETPDAEAGPREDCPLNTWGFEPFEFQLANGNSVRVVFAQFWERIRYQDWRQGARPTQYCAIKIYSTEDVLPRKMVIHCEFRNGTDFAFSAVPGLWDWLDDLVTSRRVAQFDTLSEFIDDFAEEMNRLCDAGEDAVEHVEHLPEFTEPDAFDKVDDSIFNDQNDGIAGR